MSSPQDVAPEGEDSAEPDEQRPARKGLFRRKVKEPEVDPAALADFVRRSADLDRAQAPAEWPTRLEAPPSGGPDDETGDRAISDALALGFLQAPGPRKPTRRRRPSARTSERDDPDHAHTADRHELTDLVRRSGELDRTDPSTAPADPDATPHDGDDYATDRVLGDTLTQGFLELPERHGLLGRRRRVADTDDPVAEDEADDSSDSADRGGRRRLDPSARQTREDATPPDVPVSEGADDPTPAESEAGVPIATDDVDVLAAPLVPEAESDASAPAPAGNEALREAMRMAAAADARARVSDMLASEQVEAARIAEEERDAAVSRAAELAEGRRRAEEDAAIRVAAAEARVAGLVQLAEQANAAREEAEIAAAEQARLVEEAQREAAEYARLAEDAVGAGEAQAVRAALESAAAQHASELEELRAELAAARRTPSETEPKAVPTPPETRPRSGPSAPRSPSLEPPASSARQFMARTFGRARQGGAAPATRAGESSAAARPTGDGAGDADPEPAPAPAPPPVPTPVRGPGAGTGTTYERRRGVGLAAYVAVLVAVLALLAIGLIAVGGDALDRLPSVVVLAVVALVAVLFVLLRRSTRSSVLLDSHGVLTIALGGNTHIFDLASSNVPIEVVGKPGQRAWKMRIRRRSMRPLVLDSRAVEARAFTSAVRQWRGDL